MVNEKLCIKEYNFKKKMIDKFHFYKFYIFPMIRLDYKLYKRRKKKERKIKKE